MFAPVISSAQSIEELQAQVNALLQQLAVLQAQLRTGASNAIPAAAGSVYGPCPTLTRTLQRRMSGADVTNLQIFLAGDPRIYPEGTISGYFGPLTEAAVQRFQCREMQLCSGSPNINGYGVVGPRTRATIQNVCGTIASGSPPSTSSSPVASCALPWGATIAHGASVTAYQSTTVPLGQTCLSQTRSCSNGALSGSYQYASCYVRPAPVDPISPPDCTLASSPASLTRGQSSTLGWSTQNATNVSIDQGVGPVSSQGSLVISPQQTSLYTLTAAGPGGAKTCSATITVTNAPSTLVAEWKFDEVSGSTALDSSGNGHNGILMNGATRYVGGQEGNKLQLDGIDDYLRVPESDALDAGTSNFTIAAWVRFAALTAGKSQPIFIKQNANGVGYAFFLDQNQHLALQGEDTTASARYAEIGATMLASNTWYFVVGIGDRSNGYRLYVNGVQESTTRTGVLANQAGTLSNAADVLIGANLNTGNYTSARMDKVRLYNTTLSVSEIQSLFNGTPLDNPPANSACTAPWGATVAHGASVTAYQSTTVPLGQTCLSQTRSCSNGALSGTFAHTSCAPLTTNAPASANFDGRIETVNSGVMNGWAYDKRTPSASIPVTFIARNTQESATPIVIGSANTDVLRQDVNSSAGITGAHGYSFAIPAQYQDGTIYYISVIVGSGSDANLLKASNGGATSIMYAKGEGVEIAGPEEVVYDQHAQQCASPNPSADSYARAFRDANGRIQLIVTALEGTTRMIGTAFSNLARDCASVFTSSKDPDPSKYNDREWISSLYTNDGTTVHALIHEEYHPWDHTTPPFDNNTMCGIPPSQEAVAKCWYNAITYARSTNGGAAYAQSTPSALVATIPYIYQKQMLVSGIFNPSNIVFKDGYYYMLAKRILPGLGDAGARACAFRTNNIADPTSWKAWDGTGFNLKAAYNPYQETITDPASKVCGDLTAAGGGDEGTGRVVLGGGLTFNTYLNKWVLVHGTATGSSAAGTKRIGAFYLTSDDLVHWSAPKLIMKSQRSMTDEKGPMRVYYTLIDHDDTTRNFERSDNTAYLYYSVREEGGSGFDLMRVPIRFLPTSI